VSEEEPSQSKDVRDEAGLIDPVVREEPLLITVGDEQVLTMRTPGHDEDLALGFLLSEGILERADDVLRVECSRRTDPEAAPIDVARVILAPGRAPGVLARQRLSRAHAIRPSCGLCGLLGPEGLTRHLRPLTTASPRVRLADLTPLPDLMRQQQPLFRATGGSHAAGVFSAETLEPWVVREDVGRHNAVDKALGWCAANGHDLTRSVLVLSGRAGYELVIKALRLEVPIVASVSAPSSLAVEVSVEHGQTLVCFVREGRGRVYADDERVTS
jgi:FdhD protein